MQVKSHATEQPSEDQFKPRGRANYNNSNPDLYKACLVTLLELAVVGPEKV